ncbi:MAG: hypothetical protein WAL90_05005 [Desulfobacterales bacterium]
MRHQLDFSRIGPLLLAAVALALLGGCLANYGRLNTSSDVTQAFKNRQMIAGYRYYYSGRENKPSAIIGIDPAFEFSSRFWTALEPSQFDAIVGRVSIPEYGFVYGAYILAPDGRRAGVWFSWVRNFTAKFEDDRIMVFSPEPYADADGGYDIPSH